MLTMIYELNNNLVCVALTDNNVFINYHTNEKIKLNSNELKELRTAWYKHFN